MDKEFEKLVTILENQTAAVAEMKTTIENQGKTIAELQNQVKALQGNAPEPYKKGDFAGQVQQLKSLGLLKD